MAEVDAVGFEVFQKNSAPLAKVPTVTLQRRGLLSLNRSAYALIGNPAAVELLWDPERQVIGLRPAEETNPNAYPARPQASNSDRGPFLIAGTAFTQYYKIDTSETQRWVPQVEDGILCIDISKPGQKATSNRAKAAARDRADGG